MTMIIGAGMAGLLAACTQFQGARIYETSTKEDFKKHKALLRFRSSAIGDALGIEFKKVRVHKSIYFKGKYYDETNPMLANMYSQKVIGKIEDRSIWKIEDCDRWIAPEDFHDQLIKRCEGRILWNTQCDAADRYKGKSGEPIISTIPMPAIMKLQMYAVNNDSFRSAKITVKRWRIPHCNVYQTIYFPANDINLYRASITGDILTCEYVGALSMDGTVLEYTIDKLLGIFGIFSKPEFLSESEQLGKISPIDERWRKQFLFELSHKHNIYSLGRYATWKQLLLDDVFKDISVVKRLIGSTDYESMMEHSK